MIWKQFSYKIRKSNDSQLSKLWFNWRRDNESISLKITCAAHLATITLNWHEDMVILQHRFRNKKKTTAAKFHGTMGNYFFRLRWHSFRPITFLPSGFWTIDIVHGIWPLLFHETYLKVKHLILEEKNHSLLIKFGHSEKAS